MSGPLVDLSERDELRRRKARIGLGSLASQYGGIECAGAWIFDEAVLDGVEVVAGAQRRRLDRRQFRGGKIGFVERTLDRQRHRHETRPVVRRSTRDDAV